MKFDLKYFIIRSNVLMLYREAIKFSFTIKDPQSRIELQHYIRSEFEANRKEDNRKKIEYMIAIGRKKINTFKESHKMTK